MKILTKDTLAAHVTVGETLYIELDSSPYTGYTWYVTVDSSIIDLVDSDFIPHDEHSIQTDVREMFLFEVLKTGISKIKLYLCHSSELIPTKTLDITIGVT